MTLLSCLSKSCCVQADGKENITYKLVKRKFEHKNHFSTIQNWTFLFHFSSESPVAALDAVYAMLKTKLESNPEHFEDAILACYKATMAITTDKHLIEALKTFGKHIPGILLLLFDFSFMQEYLIVLFDRIAFHGYVHCCHVTQDN